MELKDISKKRQKKRKDTDLYKVKEDISKPKYYILDMFPYPSGSALHVGHPKGYIATDALARKKILQGFNVLHPMGFDTFGLGTEQYAIEHKMKPQDVSKQNIEKFISQLENFGTTYDRSRAVNTADPKYFKWTQRVFLQMYNHYYDEKLKKAMPIASLKSQVESGKSKVPEGLTTEQFLNSQRLAYVDYKPINRCPHCMTGLANEDLDDGKCERCGSVVEQKPMKQRVLRITKYAERLLEGLDTLKREESMKDLERNWIGKSEGTEFDMNVAVPDKVSKIIILHGITGHDQRHRFQWFKKEMNKQGVEVLIPNLPNTDNPQYIEQLEFLKKEFSDKLDEHTIVIGHSLGCFLGAAFLIEMGKKIKKFINIGPVFEDIQKIDEHPEVSNYIQGIRINTKKLEDLLDEHIIFISKTDPYIPYELAKKYFEEHFHKRHIISFDDKGHFSDKNGNLTEFPELLPYICFDNTSKFSVYTTRIDTVFGMSFVAIAPEHPFVDKITTKEHLKEVNKYKEAAKHKTQLERTELQKEKTGVFCGAYAINPFNGEKVKIFVADYVLANYGTGVVMAVPAHDERDFEFARKYKLPITNSILPKDKNFVDYDKVVASEICYTEKGIVNNSAEFSGMESDKAIAAMQEWLQEKGIGGVKVNYKMQDRVFSRQRYRGEPFPILRDESGNIIALDENDLPLLLPDVDNYEPTGTEEGPLAAISDRVNATKNGKKYKRETNTMPGRAGSSRYRLRYMDVNNDQALVGKDKEKYRGNVDVYVGGAEHITRHMIYGRFWQKFLFDIDMISHDEPFQEYHSVGLIMGEDGRKMSKRRGNVVNPDDIINQFGADTLRTYEMFMGPFDQSIAWNTAGISGTKKFLDKIIKLSSFVKEGDHEVVEDLETQVLLNQTIKKLTDNIDEFKFNTAISQLMILTNHLTDCGPISRTTFETLVILLSPFAPHLAEELWEQLGNEYSLFTKATWPTYDEKCLVADTITIGVQVNGKMRGTICISKDAEQNEALQAANSDEKIKSRITSEPKKVIYVKGKILNIVV